MSDYRWQGSVPDIFRPIGQGALEESLGRRLDETLWKLACRIVGYFRPRLVF